MQARMDEDRGAITADNELGEMGSFINGGRTSGGGSGWDRELQGGGGAEGRRGASEADEDEVRLFSCATAV